MMSSLYFNWLKRSLCVRVSEDSLAVTRQMDLCDLGVFPVFSLNQSAPHKVEKKNLVEPPQRRTGDYKHNVSKCPLLQVFRHQCEIHFTVGTCGFYFLFLSVVMTTGRCCWEAGPEFIMLHWTAKVYLKGIFVFAVVVIYTCQATLPFLCLLFFFFFF